VLKMTHATDLAAIEQTLRVAFLARYGTDLGPEVTAETMAWAWEHRQELDAMNNPTGYLFRVGQSKSRRFLRWKRERLRFPAERANSPGPWTEPQLPDALAKLDEEERTAVVLVHCFQWTYVEVGELLDLPLHTVRNRIHRGLSQLRISLGVNTDV
jgi:RNA polymerase sigma-70 factor (ECF subfamily)